VQDENKMFRLVRVVGARASHFSRSRANQSNTTSGVTANYVLLKGSQCMYVTARNAPDKWVEHKFQFTTICQKNKLHSMICYKTIPAK